MCLKFKDLGKVLKTTLMAWINKDPLRRSATVAYYFWMPNFKATFDLYFGDVMPGKYDVKVAEQIIEEKV